MNRAKAIIRSRSFTTPGVNDAFLNVRGRYWGPFVRICVHFVRISQTLQWRWH